MHCKRTTLRLLLAVAGAAAMGACSPDRAAPPDATTWTLRSGVTVVSDTGCQSDTARPPSIHVEKEKKRYLIAIDTYALCGARIVEPWLTMTREGKATLVLESGTAPMSSACECGRSLKVAVADRLEQGDTLFVVSDQEVIGYATLK